MFWLTLNRLSFFYFCLATHSHFRNKNDDLLYFRFLEMFVRFSRDDFRKTLWKCVKVDCFREYTDSSNKTLIEIYNRTSFHDSFIMFNLNWQFIRFNVMSIFEKFEKINVFFYQYVSKTISWSSQISKHFLLTRNINDSISNRVFFVRFVCFDMWIAYWMLLNIYRNQFQLNERENLTNRYILEANEKCCCRIHLFFLNESIVLNDFANKRFYVFFFKCFVMIETYFAFFFHRVNKIFTFKIWIWNIINFARNWWNVSKLINNFLNHNVFSLRLIWILSKKSRKMLNICFI